MAEKKFKFRIIFKWFADFWFSLGIAFILLTSLELCCRVYYKVKDRAVQQDEESRFAVCLDNKPWRDTLIKELDESKKSMWKSYVYWRHSPYKGEFVNVDQDGIRRTLPLPVMQNRESRPIKLFMFGGSAMWGSGARDAGTIPSLVARNLTAMGLDVQVINYGEFGYVSTQEMLLLQLELQKGHVPDVAVFYDGANDIYSAFSQHVAGIPENEYNRRAEFNLLRPFREKELNMLALQSRIKKMALYRLLSKRLLSLGVKSNPAKKNQSGPTTDKSIEDRIIQVYETNCKITSLLAEQYGFSVLYYLQPLIFSKKIPSEDEKIMKAKAKDFAELAAKCYGRLPSPAFRDMPFYNFSTIFDVHPETMFFDWCHVCENANEIIANKMTLDLQKIILKKNSTAYKAISAQDGTGSPRTIH